MLVVQKKNMELEEIFDILEETFNSLSSLKFYDRYWVGFNQIKLNTLLGKRDSFELQMLLTRHGIRFPQKDFSELTLINIVEMVYIESYHKSKRDWLNKIKAYYSLAFKIGSFKKRFNNV